MIIVNQKINELINFNNVVRIYRQENDEKKVWEIGVDMVDGNYYTLGEYRTRERAIEIVLEISRNIEYDVKLYEMPEE